MSWITPSSSLGNVEISTSFSSEVLYNSTTVTFSLLSGALPPGISFGNITVAGGISTLPIIGTVLTISADTTFTFVIRANDNGLISDRTFSINVYGPMAPISFVTVNSTGNLGVYPDGTILIVNIPGVNVNPSGNLTYQIIEGGLPPGLTLNTRTGQIFGYVDPSILIENGTNTFDTDPDDTTPFDLNASLTSLTYNFNLVTSDGQQIVVAPYSLTIERRDVYLNLSANTDLAYYHPPILLNAIYTLIGNNVVTTLDLGSANSDTNFYYQLQAYDFESSPIGYQIQGGQPDIPNTITIDNTGLISGYILPNQTSNSLYNFTIRIFKTQFEPSPGSGLINPYQTIIPVTLQINTHYAQGINWVSNSNLGNLSVGQPSTLLIEANVTNPIIETVGYGASAVSTLKLNSVNIVNGGVNYNINDQLVIDGGTFTNPAVLTVTEVGNQNQILSVAINPGFQGYTELPILENVYLPGGAGDDAIFTLNFNLESVIVVNPGVLYSGATVGFSSEDEDVPAAANVNITNGTISLINITTSGSNYKGIPDVFINPTNTIINSNPVTYSLVSGTLPEGLTLTSTGLIQGRASYSIISPTTYTFIVQASVGINQNQIINELNPNNYPGSTEIIQELNQTITTRQTFNLNVLPDQIIPKSNIYLDFLLEDDDLLFLSNLIIDQNAVPTQNIYRLGDPYYGLPSGYRMLFGYGLDTASDEQMAALTNEHAKRYIFQSLNYASAIDNSGNTLYEVIYITPMDFFTSSSGQSLSGNVNITYNGNVIVARPNSSANMNTDFRTISEFSQNNLPLWMTCVQPTTNTVLGFIQAIPLVYVTPGSGAKILYNLQQKLATGVRNLNSIDATVNLYLWDDQLAMNFDKVTESFPPNLLTTFLDNTSWQDETTFGNINVDNYESGLQGDKYIILNFDYFFNNGQSNL